MKDDIAHRFAEILLGLAGLRTSSEKMQYAIHELTHGQYLDKQGWDSRHMTFWRELFRLCREWAEAHADGPYVEFKTEADWLDYAAKQFKATGRGGLPQGVFAAMKNLQAKARQGVNTRSER